MVWFYIVVFENHSVKTVSFLLNYFGLAFAKRQPIFDVAVLTFAVG